MKKEVPEFKQVHSQVLQNVLERLDNSFRGFFSRVQKGEKAGYPRFQGTNRYDSFTYPQSGFELDGKQLKLSKIGNIRMIRHQKIQGEIKTCTIKHKNGHYYVCFSCEVTSHKPSNQTSAVGVDVGISHLAITSDGKFFDNPRHLRSLEHKLKRHQRNVSKKKKGSTRRKKAVRLLAKTHEKIANKRKDTAHKVFFQLVKAYDLIVFEDLSVQEMVKNHRLAKSISDSAWKQLITFTTYKAENAGKRVVSVNPYNTSQECSNCGNIVKKGLEERTHRCTCGYEDHRDVNAAKNILKRGIVSFSV